MFKKVSEGLQAEIANLPDGVEDRKEAALECALEHFKTNNYKFEY